MGTFVSILMYSLFKLGEYWCKEVWRKRCGGGVEEEVWRCGGGGVEEG